MRLSSWGFTNTHPSGQISGFFDMEDYGARFGVHNADTGKYDFSAARQGAIVGLLPAGCLFGSLIAGNIADSLGRRMAISVSALFCCVGNIIEISSETQWAQFAVGRLVTGLGIGSLSVAVPMYQSESSPAILRGVLISCYQLFITLGIWTAEMINYGTHEMTGSASWRIPNGLSFLWSLILGAGIMFLPESPRYAYRKGREEEARHTIARLAGLDDNAPSVNQQIDEIRAKLDEERAGAATNWYEIFTGPRMLYRTLLGITLQVSCPLRTPLRLAVANCSPGRPTTHGCQLFLLLRNHHLQGHWS
jgi:SP family sugar:H+ symporter-like MFS transporter